MTGANHPFRHILGNHGPSSNDAAITNRHPGMNENLSSDPSLLTNMNGLSNKWKTCLGVVVSTRYQVSALRYNGLAANSDFVLTVKRDAISYPAPISKLKVPRSPNYDLWIHVYSVANFGAKTPKQERAPFM